MKHRLKSILCPVVVTAMLLCMAVACGTTSIEEDSNTVEEEIIEKEPIVVGFSQLGAESDWRSANTQSMKSSFTGLDGYTMIFDDGQQKQANQIMAIRKFIQQEVDYIVLAPVTENGWDTVLQEAKDANIPVIIVDRRVNVEDESLFVCWIGSDFELEAQKATEWLHQYAENNKIPAQDIHIVNIQGTLGASAQIGRTKGLQDAAEKYGWDLLAEVTGDFTQTKGKEVMKSLLQEYDNINVVYCENDNEALGAIEALEEAGKKVGSNLINGEVMVISFDGINEKARSYVQAGKISCIAECNPLLGPLVRVAIDTVESGGVPSKYYYVNEEIFSANPNITSVTVDKKEYPVTIVAK